MISTVMLRTFSECPRGMSPRRPNRHEVATKFLVRVEQWAAKTKKQQREHKLRTDLRSDLWGIGEDRVQKDLDDFRNGIVRLCRPVVNREFKAKAWPE